LVKKLKIRFELELRKMLIFWQLFLISAKKFQSAITIWQDVLKIFKSKKKFQKILSFFSDKNNSDIIFLFSTLFYRGKYVQDKKTIPILRRLNLPKMVPKKIYFTFFSRFYSFLFVFFSCFSQWSTVRVFLL
jgi:hypothetical protein